MSGTKQPDSKRPRLEKDIQEEPDKMGGKDVTPSKNKDHIQITKRDLLKRYLRETEAVKKSPNSSETVYHPSYRSVLAQRGILVRNELGSGSYSKVKRAYSFKDYASIVAVKIIDKRLAAKDFLEKFLPREQRFWPHLKHANIVQLHEMFEDSFRVYMVIEYVSGGDLLRFVQQHTKNPIPDNLVRKWATQLCDAVSYLHDREIAHRDLKLENLLLTSDNDLKLTDFGFVKGNCSSEFSKTYCGSRSYAAPEILKGIPYDPKKADVWAVTAIIYITATGRMPFDESKSVSMLLEDQKYMNIWGINSLRGRLGDLIYSGFTFDFTLRPSVRKLKAQPWFNPSSSSSVALFTGQSGNRTCRNIFTQVQVQDRKA